MKFARIPKDSADAWFGLGVIAGASVTATIFASLMALGFESNATKWSDFLYKWQTLLAGLLALFGAAMTVWVVLRQIDATHREEETHRARRHFAARAAMPAALSELVEYAKAQIMLLKAQQPRTNPAAVHGTWSHSDLPTIPAQALSTLQTCIETAEPGAMEDMAKIFEELQIMHSRLADLLKKPSPHTTLYLGIHYLEDLLIDALGFYVRCQFMFDYARGRTADLSVVITSENMCTRAFFEDLHEDQYPYLVETIQRRYPENT